MNLESVDLLIDFNTRGVHLEDKTVDEIEEILIGYYEEGKSLKQLTTELDLPIQSRLLKNSFPKIKTSIKCRYDKENLYLEFPNKQVYQKSGLTEETPFCLQCGHKNLDNCECENCIYEKRREIEETYSEEIEISLKELTLLERTILATILQGMHAKNLKEPFGSFRDFSKEENLIFFDDNYAFQKLKQLSEKKIISVSPTSKIDSFKNNEKFPSVYYPMLVSWRLNLVADHVKDEETFFMFLKYPNYSIVSSKKELNEIWMEIVKQELFRFVVSEVEEYRFSVSHDTDKEKLEDYIIRLLEQYNPGQIYCLFWMGIRQADNNRTTGVWGNYRYHQIDFIMKKVEEIEIKKRRDKEIIKTYDYPKTMNSILFTKVFFQEIAMETDWFSKMVPKVEPVTLEEESKVFYDKLITRENQTFKELEAEVVYYYFTSYGVVINDGNLDWLFTDEKTINHIAQKVEFYDFEIDFENWYSYLSIPYYMNGLYSTKYVLGLIKFLISSEYEYHMPKKDIEYVNKLETKLN